MASECAWICSASFSLTFREMATVTCLPPLSSPFSETLSSHHFSCRQLGWPGYSFRAATTFSNFFSIRGEMTTTRPPSWRCSYPNAFALTACAHAWPPEIAAQIAPIWSSPSSRWTSSNAWIDFAGSWNFRRPASASWPNYSTWRTGLVCSNSRILFPWHLSSSSWRVWAASFLLVGFSLLDNWADWHRKVDFNWMDQTAHSTFMVETSPFTQ